MMALSQASGTVEAEVAARVSEMQVDPQRSSSCGRGTGGWAAERLRSWSSEVAQALGK